MSSSPQKIPIMADRLIYVMNHPPKLQPLNAFKNGKLVGLQQPDRPPRITEKVLSEMSGFTIRTIQRIRTSGKATPDTLSKLCECLDISADYLTGNNDIVMTSFNSFQQSVKKSRRYSMREYPTDSSSFHQFKKHYKSLNRIDNKNILIMEYESGIDLQYIVSVPKELAKSMMLQSVFNQFLRLAGYAQYDFIPDGWDKSYYLQQTLDLISNLNNKMNEADISAALAADREAPPDRKPSEPEKPIPVKPTK